LHGPAAACAKTRAVAVRRAGSTTPSFGGIEVNRRQFLKLGGAAGAAVLAPRAWSPPAARAAEGVRLSGATYAAKFQAPLPRPRRVDLTDCRAPVAADMVQFQQQVLEGYPATTLWGYQHAGPPTWPGATIVAKSGHPIDMQWRNSLPIGTGDLAASHILPVDETLMIPEGLAPGHIPTVTHLHGAHVESASDGQPDGWFTQGFAQKGDFWSKATYHYANDEGAGTLWYHDHTLGITRLNVFAGLSGMCLVRDDEELGLIASGVLPATRTRSSSCSRTAGSRTTAASTSRRRRTRRAASPRRSSPTS
jgi:spore coat protein A, manganese oxidase